MTDAGAAATWVEANQRSLAAELSRLRRRIAGDAGDGRPERRRRVRDRADLPDRDRRDRGRLSSSPPFEREVLLLCAGIEMDAEFAAACAPRRERAARGATFATGARRA